MMPQDAATRPVGRVSCNRKQATGRPGGVNPPGRPVEPDYLPSAAAK